MTDQAHSRQGRRRRLWQAVAAAAVLLAVLVAPPLVSVSRYRGRITSLIAASLGRPVRLSSVEVRLLPRPGFVLSDLSVAEDPAYGAEPVLHANSVTASIRLLPLWRGRLEIGRISVDEASLNLVRTAEGRWNLDSLFRTAAAQAGPAANRGARLGVALPFLEATNSRINIKDGAEKLPFSLLNTDLSFGQEESGQWRIRLRGQPARTDLSLDLADTGVVRLDARVRSAPELRRMPVELDLEWQEAQLGQLARLVTGSDPGWRGDMTGELHLDGAADAARITVRLRATGVHRAEFAPATPLDFDANCAFVYHYSRRALENLACDSPLGDGRIRLAGELPGGDGTSRFSVELDRIPVAAGLDALRTVRSGLEPGLEAGGTVSGKIVYAASAAGRNAPGKPGRVPPAKEASGSQPMLTGSLTVEGLQLNGGGLSQPLRAPRLVLEPAAALTGQSQALAGTVNLPAGGTGPLTLSLRLGVYGYQVTVRGQASLARARDLARAGGMAQATALDGLAGDPITVDLSAAGPWLPAQAIPFSNLPPSGSVAADSLSGTVTVRNANWRADYLANQVVIAQATLHLGEDGIRWDPVVFSYGPVKGTCSLVLPASCEGPEPCSPHFEVQFGNLDAAALQTAILGAREKGTLLSELIDRLHPSSAPPWPRLEGTVKADSLLLGPVTLWEPSAALRILPTGAEIANLDAGVLGGRLSASGTLKKAATDQDKPAYTLEGRFEKLSAPAVGQLLGQRWSGGDFDADGKVELSGYTDKDLAGSAKGKLHFEWRNGAISAPAGAQAGPGAKTVQLPAVLVWFDRWTAEAEVANGTITLKKNQVLSGARRRTVEAALTLGDPPKVRFAVLGETPPGKR
jgi:hypothetical protein